MSTSLKNRCITFNTYDELGAIWKHLEVFVNRRTGKLWMDNATPDINLPLVK